MMIGFFFDKRIHYFFVNLEEKVGAFPRNDMWLCESCFPFAKISLSNKMSLLSTYWRRKDCCIKLHLHFLRDEKTKKAGSFFRNDRCVKAYPSAT